MKTVLTSIITSIITVIAVLLIMHLISDGDCMYSDDGDKKECVEQTKKCDKKHHDGDNYACCEKNLAPARADLESQLTDEEKASIAAIREKFGDVDHEKMCPEGKKKFQEQHKEDISALLAIADNHKEFFDAMAVKMHESHEKAQVKDHEKCPEAKTCKEATSKCQGEKAKTEEGEKKCQEAEAKCKKEQESCMNTFKVHFLLMDPIDMDEGDDV